MVPVRRHRSYRGVVLALGLTATALGACGEDTAATCVASLCDPGVAKTCSGNDVRRCVDGTRYDYTACGAQQRCDASGGDATCVPHQCTTLGVATCRTPTTIEQCREDGSGVDTFACGTGERCMDGACVSQVCGADGDVCTTNGYLRCQAGAWQTTSCSPGEICSLAAGVASCGPRVCEPGVQRCVDAGDRASARACNARGTVETGTTCAAGEGCVAGRCQAQVCGQDTPDATSGDTGEVADAPATEQQITFRIGGETIVMNQSAFVAFDDGSRTLTLRAARSTRQLRILFENSRSTLTGRYTDTEFSTVRVVVCWNDGGAAQTFDRCPAGFTHQSSAYVVDITQNPGPNLPGRVEGTFSATVNDENGDPTSILDGNFSLGFR